MNYNIKLNKIVIPRTKTYYTMSSVVFGSIKNDIVLIKNRFGARGQSIFNNIKKS